MFGYYVNYVKAPGTNKRTLMEPLTHPKTNPKGNALIGLVRLKLTKVKNIRKITPAKMAKTLNLHHKPSPSGRMNRVHLPREFPKNPVNQYNNWGLDKNNL